MPRHSPKSKSISTSTFRLAVVLAGVLAHAAPAAAQSPPPDADWLTFSTEHFRVTYTAELEPLARRAGAVAERTYAVLREELGEPPSGMIDLLVTDHVDYTNGFAQPFPSNRILVYARPPTFMPQLAYTRDWMELVVAHELVHIFHLDEAGAVGNAIRSVFGQLPMVWPVFPVAGSPTWNVEGLATYYETRLTGTGRVAGSFHDMLIRTAALEDRIPDLDVVAAPHPAWPGGQRSYGYGSRLMQYIAERYGPESHRAIVEATGGSIRPTFLFFDHVSRAAVGKPFDALYDEWREEATRSAHELADRVRAAGVTVTEPVAGGEGPFAAMPRVSSDGGRLSFAAHDYRSDPATRVVDLSTGATRTVARRNQFGSLLGPAAWLPDGSGLITAQLEMRGLYRAFSDLWRVDPRGGERRLTRGQRIAQPDVGPDGRRVAGVRAHEGGLQLVVHDLDSGATRVLADPGPGHAFDTPRWSPDGERIAAGRYSDGRVDIVVVDVGTGREATVTRDDALDLAPAWSPDGDWLLWWSDRTGIPNIMAVRTADIAAAPAPVRQVTNLLTGGFDPEVSPDGRTLYLSVYHHDGWRIERMAFDTAAWTTVGESVVRHGPGLLPEPERSSAGAGARPAEEAAASSYRAWPSLRPHFWFPEWSTVGGDGGELSFLGVYTGGRDLVSRHEWEASVGVDLGTGRQRGRVSWIYRGLGNPDLRLDASRRWSRVALLDLGDEKESIFRRTDRLAADAFLWRARWRSRGWLRLGAEAERRELQAHDLSDAELRAARVTLPGARTLVGASGGPGYSNARYHPFSISAEDGVAGSVGAGRWWDVTSGTRAFDEVIGRFAGYLGFPVWGFANHVLAARAAGLRRDGDEAAAHSIGGVPSGASRIPGVDRLVTAGAFLPVRGFDSGARAGTRAWAVSGEWRFPLHMRDAPGRVLGFSLTSLSGALFADVGDAWCRPSAPDQLLAVCSPPSAAPLLSAGAELNIDFGVLHNTRALVRLGVAQPIRGPGDGKPSFYVGVGPAF